MSTALSRTRGLRGPETLLGAGVVTLGKLFRFSFIFLSLSFLICEVGTKKLLHCQLLRSFKFVGDK